MLLRNVLHAASSESHQTLWHCLETRLRLLRQHQSLQLQKAVKTSIHGVMQTLTLLDMGSGESSYALLFVQLSKPAESCSAQLVRMRCISLRHCYQHLAVIC